MAQSKFQLMALAAGMGAALLAAGGVLHTGVLAAPATPGKPLASAVAGDSFDQAVRPFFAQHCVKCHGPDKKKGDLAVHTLSVEIARTAGEHERWKRIAEMIATGEMPPAGQTRPSPHAAGRALKFIKEQLASAGQDVSTIGAKLNMPQHGNRVDHDALFAAGQQAVASSPARLWRVSPMAYEAFARRVGGKDAKVAQPFGVTSAEGFKDYADLYSIDEPTINQLFRNADAIVATQTREKNNVKELAAIVQGSPSPAAVEAAIRKQFDLVLRRPPTADELKRFTALYTKNVADAGQETGARATLAAVLMLPEALYRMELGDGPADAHGRRMLAPRELARAIALALTDEGPDAALLKAADTGKLATPQDVQREVQRLMNDPKVSRARVMRFFDEYFQFPHVENVFKDIKPGEWKPDILIGDTRRLIHWALDQDKDVLRTLLTTNKSFVNYRVDPRGNAMPARIANKNGDPKPKVDKNGKVQPAKPRLLEYSDLYGLPHDWQWTAQQPIDLPADQRAGILTQPSWLAAYATNNETHAIRRGKWIREHLLGGAIPDLPITVDAKLPDAPDKTMRQRMEVTKAEYCWNCHQQMNPLGLAFEKYDFLGQYRTSEVVQDIPATQAKQAAAQAKADADAAKKKKQPEPAKPVEPVTREVPADGTGDIALSGDAKLDGPVTDGIALIHKLADSPRVRQVFVRHAFRYWMGRNETLEDAATLVAADHAYVQSGGSMKALIVALMTSDSFLYRK